MRTIKATVGAVLLAAGFAGAASAAPIVDEEVPPAPVAIKVGTSHTFTHDLTANGYTPGVDTLTSAGLAIVLTDENGNEDYRFVFGNGLQTYTFTEGNISGDTSFSFSVLAESLTDLRSDGRLDVTIWADYCNGSRCGDHAFYFVSSTLTAQVAGAEVDPTANAVSEPGTLALLGLGLAGVVALRRRRTTASPD